MNSSTCLPRFWRGGVGFSARNNGFIAKYCDLGEIYCDPSEIYCDPRSRFFDIMYAKLDNINVFLGIIYELLCMFMEVLVRSGQFFCTKPWTYYEILRRGERNIAIRAKYIAIRAQYIARYCEIIVLASVGTSILPETHTTHFAVILTRFRYQNCGRFMKILRFRSEMLRSERNILRLLRNIATWAKYIATRDRDFQLHFSMSCMQS